MFHKTSTAIIIIRIRIRMLLLDCGDHVLLADEQRYET
jgi:hypothetical protein